MIAARPTKCLAGSSAALAAPGRDNSRQFRYQLRPDSLEVTNDGCRFRHRKWANDDIGFHEGAVNPLLVKHWPALSLVGGPCVFLPLCGKTFSMFTGSLATATGSWGPS